MLEKKHLVFLAGATAPFAPPLCTALLTEGYASSNSRIFRALGKLPAFFISRHIRTLTHEPIVKLKAILSRKQTQAEVNQSYKVFVQKERR